MLIDKGTVISISDEILNNYILNKSHTFGKRKSKILKSLGFNKSNIDLLKKELTIFAKGNRTVRLDSLIGTTLIFKQQVDGILKGPNKKCLYIKTYWIQTSYKVEFLTFTVLK